MQRFTTKIVDLMKQENLYASQGGPIILSQIENEYGNIQSDYGPRAKPYVEWAAAMATSLDTGVPWVMCQQADAPDPIASVYKTGSGLCSAFLANIGTQSDATVTFNGNSYHLPAWSVSILPDCKNVALNTAKINSVATIPRFVTQSSEADTSGASLSGWSWVNEPVGISSDKAFTKDGLVEQINTTADTSDYLWYSLSIEIKGDEPFLQDGSQAVLHVQSLGHALHAFINGKLAGSGKGGSNDAKVSINVPVSLVPGKNKIDLLSLTVGLQNYGGHFDLKGAGITGPVQLKDSKSGSSIDLSSQKWTYQVGLKGEELSLFNGDSSLWTSQPALPTNQPLICYHVPRSWLKSSGNVLVVFEEVGGDPTKLSFATREVGSLCSRVSESHPMPVDMWTSDVSGQKQEGATLSLECPLPNQVISTIKFASFGTPQGTCGSFSHGKCKSTNALSVVKKACIGSRNCSLGVSSTTFGNPCAGVIKSLAVEASCA
nr:beta-galactosidase 8 [Ipomoea batatas]